MIFNNKIKNILLLGSVLTLGFGIFNVSSLSSEQELKAAGETPTKQFTFKKAKDLPAGISVTKESGGTKYLKMQDGSTITFDKSILLAENNVLTSDLSLSLAIGTFGTWATKNTTITAEFLGSNDILSTATQEYKNLGNSENTYQTPFTIKKPTTPSDISALKVTFNHPDKGNVLRLGGAKLYYEESLDVDITDIRVEGTATKSVYLSGETFDPTGIKVFGIYDKGELDITSNVTWPEEPLTLATNKVLGTYQSGTKSFQIEYTDFKVAKLTALEISGEAKKLVYNEGETFDPTGLTVKAIYDTGSVDVTDVVVWSNEPLKVGDKNITCTLDKYEAKLSAIYSGLTVNKYDPLEGSITVKEAMKLDLGSEFKLHCIVTGLKGDEGTYVADQSGYGEYLYDFRKYNVGDELVLHGIIDQHDNNKQIKVDVTKSIYVVKRVTPTEVTPITLTLDNINTSRVYDYVTVKGLLFNRFTKVSKNMTDVIFNLANGNEFKVHLPKATIDDYDTFKAMFNNPKAGEDVFDITGIYSQYKDEGQITYAQGIKVNKASGIDELVSYLLGLNKNGQCKTRFDHANALFNNLSEEDKATFKTSEDSLIKDARDRYMAWGRALEKDGFTTISGINDTNVVEVTANTIMIASAISVASLFIALVFVLKKKNNR